MKEYSLPNVPKRIREDANLDSIIIDDNSEYGEMISAEQFIYEGMDRNFKRGNE